MVAVLVSADASSAGEGAWVRGCGCQPSCPQHARLRLSMPAKHHPFWPAEAAQPGPLPSPFPQYGIKIVNHQEVLQAMILYLVW